MVQLLIIQATPEPSDGIGVLITLIFLLMVSICLIIYESVLLHNVSRDSQKALDRAIDLSERNYNGYIMYSTLADELKKENELLRASIDMYKIIVEDGVDS